jgi:hypothetical protein
MNERRVRSAQFLWYLRMASSQTLHMDLVKDGIVQRRKRRPVVSPIER